MKTKASNKPIQEKPCSESQLFPAPEFQYREEGINRLKEKVALITGADSGIGRAVAVEFAMEEK